MLEGSLKRPIEFHALSEGSSVSLCFVFQLRQRFIGAIVQFSLYCSHKLVLFGVNLFVSFHIFRHNSRVGRQTEKV